MTNVIFDDVRRILLGLLFVIAFGWMAAQIVPGGAEREAAQVAVSTGMTAMALPAPL